MKKIDEVLAGCRSVAILGHVHPDGDCVGSCLGLYHYIRKRMPEAETDVYLEPFPKEFAFLNGADRVRHEFDTEKVMNCVSSAMPVTGSVWERARRFWTGLTVPSASIIIRPIRDLPGRLFWRQRSALPVSFSTR